MGMSRIDESRLGPAYTRARLRIPDKLAGANKLEREWARRFEWDHAPDSGVDPWPVLWRFEKFRVQLAPKTWYTVDFWVLFSDGHVECQEVKQTHRATKKQRLNAQLAGKPEPKGTTGWKDDARVKFKVAADSFPELHWIAVEKQLDGTWTQTRVQDLFKRTKS